MKILYFHQHFSTPNGSTGIRSYQMARQLIDRGHQVTMVCGSYGGGETNLLTKFSNGKREGIVDGIRIIEFNLAYSNNDSLIRRSVIFLKFSFRSIKLVFSERYDLLFSTTTPLTAALPGIFSRWFRRKVFVFQVRDLWPELPREMGVIKNPLILGSLKLLEWAAYKSAVSLIALSPGIKEGIQRLGIKASQVAMIPNGCDLSIFSNKSVEGWRPEGVAGSDFLAVYTGTHGVANGLDAVLSAAIELKKRQRDDIKLVLVGQGKLRAELMEKAKRNNLDNVVFHKPVSKYHLAGLLASADIGMQLLANVPAFYYGTSPNKFFDYISAGLPVLNNYPGWIADMIFENNCGVTIPPEDPMAFSDALEELADNRSLLPKMGVAARDLAEKDFDRAVLADDFVAWLEASGQHKNISGRIG